MPRDFTQEVSSAVGPEVYAAARRRIDSLHAADPSLSAEGGPAELRYADEVERWVVRLFPGASPLLRLAARCQHLERWKVPRQSFPEGRAGYLAWRGVLYGKQAERAREVLLENGVPQEEADAAYDWIAKKGLKTNSGTQALEDAAVLVFLEREIGAFVAQHTDYPREKFLRIVAKSWRKLSEQARGEALALELPGPIAELVREAVASAGE